MKRIKNTKLSSFIFLVFGILVFCPQYVSADFYVVPVAPRFTHLEVVSAFVAGIDQGDDHTLMTVPAGKKFILTDIAISAQAVPEIKVFIKENSTAKFYFLKKTVDQTAGDMGSISFKSGIPFAPGTSVVMNPNMSVDNGVYVTITGYLINN
jgi:hypothetical protein